LVKNHKIYTPPVFSAPAGNERIRISGTMFDIHKTRMIGQWCSKETMTIC